MRFFSLIELLVSFALGALLFSLCFQGFVYFQPKNKPKLEYARQWAYTNSVLKEMLAFAKKDLEKRNLKGLSFVFDQGIDIHGKFSDLNVANLFLEDRILKLTILNSKTRNKKTIHLMVDVEDFKIYNKQLELKNTLVFQPEMEGVVLEITKYKKPIRLYIK
ncbi:MAG: hypothetical protein K940chlam8_00254 [Chlamydiae bacterium]|nr:hypothetical protein [Chlamydiota bacterium]